jgi:site-specific recombinase XerC
MKCSRCRRWIEGREIKFAVEGDWMGKPLCKKCEAEVENKAREKYQRGLAKQHSIKNHYWLNIYRSYTDGKVCARGSRAKITENTKNPRLKRITFHTFRHWKATMEYHKTKDILHVMKMLGHKNINNTLMYTQLIKTDEDEFVSKVAKTGDETCELIELGYEYVTEFKDKGIKIFRKRK